MDPSGAPGARSPQRTARAEAAAWIVRLHGPHRSPELEAAFRDWLAAHPENGKQFERVTEAWDAGSSLPIPSASRSVGRGDTSSRRRWILAPAVLVLCTLAGWGAWYAWADPTYTTGVGEERVVRLDDGTRVSLNSDTRVAETFKYFYLLFSPPDTLDFDSVVFNTQGHPLPRVAQVDAAGAGAVKTPPFVFKTTDGKTSITIDTSAAPELKEWAEAKLAPVLAQWYPRIDTLLASDGFVAPARVTVTLRPQPGVAETMGSDVSGNSTWFQTQLNGEAVGAMVHELVHVVQQYGDRQPETFPGWLTEGIADYVRFFKYEPDYHGADDVWLGKHDFSKIRFDGAYRQTANFLDWVTRKYDPQIVMELNAAARRGTYSENIWKEKSGKTLAELGKEWREEKAQALSAPP